MPAYTTIAALRAEGVTEAQADDARLTLLISLVSTLIDRYTGRTFEPVAKTITVDGHGGRALLLHEPIISIDSITILAGDFAGPGEPIDLENVRIYNRHLTENLSNPDDRKNPKIEWFRSEANDFDGWTTRSNFSPFDLFPRGRQNIEITGTFGYTDWDGTPEGKTPDLIEHAAKLMVIRQLPLLSATDDREDAAGARPIVSIKTRDQEVRYASPNANPVPFQSAGHFTGVPEIDNILAMFVRPIQIAAV